MANNFLQRLEGGGASQLVQIMKTAGYNKPVDFLLGTVIESPPNIRVKLDTDELILEHDDLIISRTLTRHERIVTIEHVELAERDLGDKKVQDFLDTDDLALPATTYKHSYVKLTHEDVLKPGDRVVIAEIKESMMYVIIDVAVFY